MKWHDYTHRGRWTHSCLYDNDGNLVAQCFGRYRTDNCTRPCGVIWMTIEDDYEDEAATRRAAKSAARRRVLDSGQ